MSTIETRPELPPALRRLLDVVRPPHRAYVWVEGIAVLMVLIGAAFWLGLVLDWSFEPSAAVRQAAMVVLGAAALYVVNRYLLRRVFAPISDASLAVLLERRFPSLNEHLATAVDVARPDRPAAYDAELVSHTNQDAVRAVANVQANELFNRGPLLRAVSVAALLVCSIGLFALASREAFGFWLQRIALSEQAWPRRVSLEVVGFEPDTAGNRVHKLAQDDNFELQVRALTADHEIPDEVEIRFRLADGRRGRDTMIRVGEANRTRDEFQLYRYEFKRVAGDMSFDVVGGDDRVRNLELKVVDRPELFALELECAYPSYLQRPPRRLPVTGGMRIPEGTRLVLHASSTKPLVNAKIHATNSKQDATVEFGDKPQTELTWDYGLLADDDVLLVDVTDADQVASREPYRVSLAVVRDEVPQIVARLAGIGTAITPDAMLPLKGKITDDYGLDRIWFEYQVEGGPAGTRQFARQPAGEPELANLDTFDTRAINEATGQREFTLRPGQKLAVTLLAADRFDLSDAPRAGSSQRFALDVVTPGDLLALLERRELQLRQRFEAIYDKLSDTRNLMGRVEFEDKAGAKEGGEDTADKETSAAAKDDAGAPASESAEGAAARALARRRLRIAGSLQNVVQSADEVSGVAESFDDLHDQITNNRIDNPDLKSRLREQIAQPLHRIGEKRMPELADRLKLVEEHLNDAEGPPALGRAIALADEVLVEMRGVLDRMLELETYNEVVGLLRGIISDQQEINRRTKDEQKSRLRGLLEDEGS